MILLVEDESSSMLLESLFIRQFCPKEQLLTFMDPQKVYEHFDRDGQRLPDIIFSDLHFPGSHRGTEVLHFFRHKGFVGEFWFVTGRYREEVGDDILRTPNVGFIQKPVVRKDFQEVFCK